MTEADLVLEWARAFATTVVVELAIATPLLARAEPSVGRRLGIVLAGQLASHPIVWFVLPALVRPYPAFVAVAESWAWASEAALYALALRVPAGRALGVSFAANAASVCVGLALRALGAPI